MEDGLEQVLSPELEARAFVPDRCVAHVLEVVLDVPVDCTPKAPVRSSDAEQLLEPDQAQECVVPPVLAEEDVDSQSQREDARQPPFDRCQGDRGLAVVG